MNLLACILFNTLVNDGLDAVIKPKYELSDQISYHKIHSIIPIYNRNIDRIIEKDVLPE